MYLWTTRGALVVLTLILTLAWWEPLFGQTGNPSTGHMELRALLVKPADPGSGTHAVVSVRNTSTNQINVKRIRLFNSQHETSSIEVSEALKILKGDSWSRVVSVKTDSLPQILIVEYKLDSRDQTAAIPVTFVESVDSPKKPSAELTAISTLQTKVDAESADTKVKLDGLLAKATEKPYLDQLLGASGGALAGGGLALLGGLIVGVLSHHLTKSREIEKEARESARARRKESVAELRKLLVALDKSGIGSQTVTESVDAAFVNAEIPVAIRERAKWAAEDARNGTMVEADFDRELACLKKAVSDQLNSLN